MEKLTQIARDLYLRIQQAKHLVDNGKEVPCSRELQGCLAKCIELLQELAGEKDVGDQPERHGDKPDGNV